jgi:hypothetical protein
MDRQPARLMNVAEGSLEVARYHLRLAQGLGYARERELSEDVAEIGRLLGSYARPLLHPAS